MNFTKKTLPNGLRIIAVPLKDNPTVTIQVMVEAGSKHERKEQGGISHFFEHMCFKGTPKRPSTFHIAQELDGIGAHYNAFTTQEFTGYHAKSQAKNVDKILDVISDIVLNPLLDSAEIDKEKGVITDEIKMYEDIPHRHIHDVFLQLLYGDQPAGWNVAGTRESVRGLTRDALVQYRDQQYVSGATAVVVCGQFDEASLFQKIEDRFSAIPAGERHAKTRVVESQDAPQLVVERRDISQASLILGVRSYDIFHASIPAVNVMATLLGGGMSSRLFMKLRSEMGIGYSVHVLHEPYTDHGYLGAFIGMDPSRVQEVVQAILAEFSKLKEELVSPEELARTKEHMIGSLYLALESSDSIADFYGTQEILRRPLLLPQDIVAEIQAVTAEDIRAVARDIFKDSALNMALISPVGDEKQLLPLLHF